MKIKYVHLIGFRGYKESTRIDFPPGFAVITGLNGAGKSTLCDAIEYALTGTIRAYSSHTEKGESIRDYLWWRGANPSTDRRVELGFALPDGKEIVVRRDQNGKLESPGTGLEKMLLNPGPSLDNPLFQLCRTSIIRDEEISALSIDLPETERFDFVRSALGTADFSSALTKTKQITEQLKVELAAAEREYGILRDRASQLNIRISQERKIAEKSTQLAAAIALLKEYVTTPSDDIGSLSSLAEKELSEERTRIEMLTHYYARLDGLIKEKQRIVSPEYKTSLKRDELLLGNLEKEATKANESVRRVNSQLEEMQKDSPMLASLARLYESGNRLGRIDGCCPLCGREVAAEVFSAHLDKIRLTMETSKAEITGLMREITVANIEAGHVEIEVKNLRAKIENMRKRENEISAEIESVHENAKAMGYKNISEPMRFLLDLNSYIEKMRNRLNQVENAIYIVQASQAASRLVELEREKVLSEGQFEGAGQLISKINRVNGIIQEASQIIRRLQGEVVDEQLSALSPLLLELFQRLRPHIDWQKVQYHLRGDIRRMLSLEVGSGQNPSFIFSSGQRRAAGLAFLLAIHLSRNWCRLQTLILDDPVQHVDDYRALHLTEVLAAIRRTGKQLICTIEDISLAVLLARRLRSAEGDEGVVIRLEYEPGRGSHVATERAVIPPMKRILVSDRLQYPA